MRLHLLGAALLTAGLAGGALAQDPSVPLKARPTDPNMPSQQATPPERVRPQDPAATGTTVEGRGNLSDTLSRTDGVLRPAETGAGTVIAPPATNSGMPVIAPPSVTTDGRVQSK